MARKITRFGLGIGGTLDTRGAARTPRPANRSNVGRGFLSPAQPEPNRDKINDLHGEVGRGVPTAPRLHKIFAKRANFWL